MGRWSFLLGVTVALCGFMVGCDRGITAAEIAQSYGVIGQCFLCDKALVRVIESGEADKMVDGGQARTRSYVKKISGHVCTREVLVKEYLIEGHVYKIEVRRSVDPLMNIQADRLRWFEYGTGGNNVPIDDWISVGIIAATIKNHSYEADGETAYVAWQGADCKVHPVRVMPIAKVGTNWNSEITMDLYLRTKEWPDGLVWIKGLTSEWRRLPSECPDPSHAPDGRWLILCDGPAVDMKSAPYAQGIGTNTRPFYNYELSRVLKKLAECRGYDTRVLD